MLRFFLDASILFSLVYSDVGASRELFRLATLDKVTLITSRYALNEARRRITDSYPDLLPLFTEIIDSGVFLFVEADLVTVQEAALIIEDIFDAPIIASAKIADIDALLSFDTRHIHTLAVEDFIGAPVLKAGNALKMVRS